MCWKHSLPAIHNRANKSHIVQSICPYARKSWHCSKITLVPRVPRRHAQHNASCALPKWNLFLEVGIRVTYDNITLAFRSGLRRGFACPVPWAPGALGGSLRSHGAAHGCSSGWASWPLWFPLAICPLVSQVHIWESWCYSGDPIP